MLISNQALGVEHNLITLLKAQGKTTQEALDEIDVMMQSIFKRWYKALADVPIYGEKLDREVLKFVDACRDVALGNLYWRLVNLLKPCDDVSC